MSAHLFLCVEPLCRFKTKKLARHAYHAAASEFQRIHATSERQLALVRCSECDAFVRPFIVFNRQELDLDPTPAEGEERVSSVAAAAAPMRSSQWDTQRLASIMASCSKRAVEPRSNLKSAHLSSAKDFNQGICDGYVSSHKCPGRESPPAAGKSARKTSELVAVEQLELLNSKGQSAGRKRPRVELSRLPPDAKLVEELHSGDATPPSDSDSDSKDADVSDLSPLPPDAELVEELHSGDATPPSDSDSDSKDADVSDSDSDSDSDVPAAKRSGNRLHEFRMTTDDAEVKWNKATVSAAIRTVKNAFKHPRPNRSKKVRWLLEAIRRLQSDEPELLQRMDRYGTSD